MNGPSNSSVERMAAMLRSRYRVGLIALIIIGVLSLALVLLSSKPQRALILSGTRFAAALAQYRSDASKRRGALPLVVTSHALLRFGYLTTNDVGQFGEAKVVFYTDADDSNP